MVLILSGSHGDLEGRKKSLYVNECSGMKGLYHIVPYRYLVLLSKHTKQVLGVYGFKFISGFSAFTDLNKGKVHDLLLT